MRRLITAACTLLLVLWFGRKDLAAQVVDDLNVSQPATAVVTPEQATRNDLVHWQQLLNDGNFAELDRIASELRAKRAKYANGRGKDWRFYWTSLKEDHHSMSEEDYRRAFLKVEAWLAAVPDSVAARLMLANWYHQYSFHARGGDVASDTSEAKLQMFADRNAKAGEYLDEIAENPDRIDNVYRRLRIEISKGIGEKPDVELVYEGLRSDPLNMELVHGMAICLLPRWYGDYGELEQFANEVVRRTEADCGALQYLIAVMATKEFLKEYVLLEHQFDIEKIRRATQDAVRLYPEATEYYDEAAQLLFLAGDVPGAIEALEHIKDRPTLKQWQHAEINFDAFRILVSPALLEGDQSRMIVGSTTPMLLAEPIEGGQRLATMDREGGLRIYDMATGDAPNWSYLPQIKPWTVSFHETGSILLSGVHQRNAAAIYNIVAGEMGLIPTFKQVEATSFSPDGKFAATADSQGIVIVHDMTGGQEPRRFSPDRLRHLVAMAFSPDSRQLAVTTRYGALLLIDLEAEGDGQQTTLQVSEHGLRSLAWSEKYIALGGWRGTVFLLDRERREVVKQWSPEQEIQVRSLDFSPDGQLLAIGHDSENPAEEVAHPLSIWRVEADGAPRPLKGHLCGVPSVRFMADGKSLVTASRDWTIRFWDIK